MRRWKWILYSALTLATAALLYLGYLYLANRTLSAKLAAFTAELDITDPGWRFEDILNDYQSRIPPDAKNPFAVVKAAANKSLAAIKLLPEKEEVWLPEVELNRRPKRDDVALVGCVLYECRDALEIARTLKDYPCEGGAKPLIALDVISTPLRYSIELQRISEILEKDNLFKCLHSESVEAIDSLICQMHLARSLGEEPFVNSMLIRYLVFSRAIKSLERTLALVEPPAASLNQLLPLLQAEADFPHVRIMARGERATLNRLFENLESGQDNLHAFLARSVMPPLPGAIAAISKMYRYQVKHDHMEMLLRTTHLVQIAEKPSHLRYAHAIAFEKPPSSIFVLMQVLCALGLKDLDRPLIATDLRFHTRLRCAQVAIRCEQYRQKHGSWPTNPDLPLDPYTGQPLRYRRYNGGVVIYSPGLDGKDNDGNLAAKDDPGTDVGFRLWDAARRNQE